MVNCNSKVYYAVIRPWIKIFFNGIQHIKTGFSGERVKTKYTEVSNENIIFYLNKF